MSTAAQTSMAALTLGAWHRLVGRVAPFASKDDTVPTLCSVHLFERGGHLYAEATDRYRLAMTVAADDDTRVDEGFEALVPLAAVQHLDKATRTPARNRHEVRLGLRILNGGSALEVSASGPVGGNGFGAQHLTLVYPLRTEEYPNLSSLVALDAPVDPEHAGAVSFTPAFLADYKKVAERNQPVVLVPRGTKPTLVRIGEDFVGAVMPVRHSSDTDDHSHDKLDVWAHLRTPATEGGEPT